MTSAMTARPAHISNDEWEVRQQLAACYRLVGLHGWTDLVFTHISARVPGPKEYFLLNPFGSAFDEVTASSLVRIDLEGNVVDASGARIHRAGFVIHSAVHGARSDAGCVKHLRPVQVDEVSETILRRRQRVHATGRLTDWRFRFIIGELQRLWFATIGC